jgi:homoserine kinase
VGADFAARKPKKCGWSICSSNVEAETEFGFEIEIYKHIKAGSGIGSSAASSASCFWDK